MGNSAKIRHFAPSTPKKRMIFALKNPEIGEKDQYKRLNEREANTESLPGPHNN